MNAPETACPRRPGFGDPCIESIAKPGRCTFCGRRMHVTAEASRDPRTSAAREVALRSRIERLGRVPSQLERDWYRDGWTDARDHLREVADQSIRDVTASLEAEQRRSAELEAELARLMEERNGKR